MRSTDRSTKVPKAKVPANIHRRTRGLLGGGIGLTVLVAAVLLAAPLTSAHGTVTFTAPYTGFTTTPSNYVSHSGCAAVHQPTLPTWNSSTGAFQVSSTTSATSCTGSNFAEAYTAVSLSSPLFSAPFPGFGDVYAQLTSAFAARASLHLAPTNTSNGSYVFAESSVSLTVAIYIYDATHHNDTLFGYASDNLVSQYFTTTGTFSISSGLQTNYVSAVGTFTGGHVYEAYVYISATVFVDTYGGGSTAGASIDVSGANTLTISSITAT
jgi:hypothetical protein